MKKFLAVLLAALMIFSVMAVGVVAVAEDTTTGTAADGGHKTELPDWLVELIARIKQVVAKILLKFGIKIKF